MDYRTCDFPECGRKHHSHGLCRSHLGQRMRGQDLTPIGSAKRGPRPGYRRPRNPGNPDLFWSKVEKTDECWEWRGIRDTGGYGFAYWRGKHLRAHRLALELSGVELVPGLVVDHLCANKVCCNPEHLEQVTQAENMRRADMSGRKGVKPVRGPMGPNGEAICGSAGMYRKGCRCDLCRAHQAARVKDYRKRKAAQIAA